MKRRDTKIKFVIAFIAIFAVITTAFCFRERTVFASEDGQSETMNTDQVNFEKGADPDDFDRDAQLSDKEKAVVSQHNNDQPKRNPKEVSDHIRNIVITKHGDEHNSEIKNGDGINVKVDFDDEQGKDRFVPNDYIRLNWNTDENTGAIFGFKTSIPLVQDKIEYGTFNLDFDRVLVVFNKNIANIKNVKDSFEFGAKAHNTGYEDRKLVLFF